MKRKNMAYLQEWLASRDRRPLVIRGARQVGKTYLVRDLCRLQNKKLIELNFEKQPSTASYFESNDPRQILLNLSAFLNQSIDPHECLLFLDEIQAVPELFAKLRWFAEDLPELAVIAAGSLLELILETHTFSMPVGRITYMHLEPMSFEEFLLASEKTGLLNYLNTFSWNNKIPQAIHEQCIRFFKEYLIVGGMPAVVQSWTTDRSLIKVSQIQRDLTATYRDDFNKYKGRIDKERLEEVLVAIPEQLGEKFMYSKVNAEVQSRTVKHAFDLLCKARVCHRVTSCHANGVPLAAGLDKSFFKAVFLDVGLCSAALGFTMDQISQIDEINFINKGGLAEQVVGQLLRTIEMPYVEPELYYWLTQKKSGSAEVDYILQHGHNIIPIKVKAGSTGSLKSLHIFMGFKKLATAVRFNSDIPSFVQVPMQQTIQTQEKYLLYSLPFYLIEQLHRLLSLGLN